MPPRRSDPPYTRLGAARTQQPEARTVPLDGRTSPFAVAWAATGEWRDWRDMLEASGVDDPFNLAGAVHAGELAMWQVFEDLDGGPPELVDLTAALGHGITLHTASPELEGRAVLGISDTAAGEYALHLRATEDADPGAGVALVDADFDDLDGAPLAVRRVLADATGQLVVDLSMTRDAFTVLWFARELLLIFAPTRTRDALRLPSVELLV